MKMHRLYGLLGLALLPLAAAAATPTPTLVKDLSPITQSSNPRYFTSYKGAVYFFADDGSHGRELWRTDAAGTSLVRDVNPGAASAEYDYAIQHYQYSSPVFTCGGRLCFFANDGKHGRELWSTDGTSAGTVLVKDFVVSSGDGENQGPVLHAIIGSRAYLWIHDPIKKTWSLWATDGTSKNTWRVKGGSTFEFPSVFAMGGKTWYLNKFNGKFGIWRVNGVGQEASLAVDLSTAGATSARGISNYKGKYYFSMLVEGQNELWVTDGTSAGTSLVTIVPNGKYITESILWQDRLAFVAMTSYSMDDGTEHMSHLYQTDGTNEGTIPLTSGDQIMNLTTDGTRLYYRDVPDSRLGGGNTLYAIATPGGERIQIQQLGDAHNFATAILGGQLYFSLAGGDGNSTLWRSEGTSATLVKTLSGTIDAGFFQAAGDKLFFRLSNTAQGRDEIWSSTGTAAGTKWVKSGEPYVSTEHLVAEGKLYYATHSSRATEPWVTDIATGKSLFIKDINTKVVSFDPRNLTVAGDQLFFNSNSPVGNPNIDDPYALWRTDGTAAGTKIVYPGANQSDYNMYWRTAIYYTPMQAVGQSLYLREMYADDYLLRIFKTDGKSLSEGSSYFVVANGKHTSDTLNGIVYFAAVKHPYGVGEIGNTELWRTDGTLAGTQLVREINPGVNGSNPEHLTPIGNRLYFRANNGKQGTELWRTDGTNATTVMVKDINPGPKSSNPRDFVPLGKVIVFSAYEETRGRELWRTDGTAAGTVRIKDLLAGAKSAEVDDLTSAGTRVFFTTFNPSDSGRSLWVTNGTAAGTLKLRQFINGQIRSLTAIGTSVYFVAEDGVHGAELWRSNGTVGGTALVSDLYPGSVGSRPEELVAAQGKLYFRTNKPAALNVYDPVRDVAKPISTGWPVSLPAGKAAELTYFQGKLYFVGQRSSSGRELWSLPLDSMK